MVEGILSGLGVREISAIGMAVIVTLLLLSIWSTIVAVDRALALRRARRQSVAFAHALAANQAEDWLQAAIDTAHRYPHSHLARVVAAGICAFKTKKSRGHLSTPEVIAAAERALERAAVIKSAELARGVGSLATIATTAPFIGLFGTVIGIIHAFEAIGRSQGGGGFSVVSQGIAEALVTTALGIIVAIPAAWAFNHLTAHIERLRGEMANSSSELTDFFVDFEHGALPGVAPVAA